MAVPRNGQGRPWIAYGIDVKCYSRASNFAQPLKDSKGLAVHHNKLIIKGMVVDPSIMTVFAKKGGMKLGTDAEKDEGIDHNALFAMTERAIDAAGGNRKAKLGTLIHGATEYLDRTEQVPFELFQKITDYVGDINAYLDDTRPLKRAEIETFIVNDEWKVAGTFDRIFESDEPVELQFGDRRWTLPPGRYIADIKTGTLDYTPGAFAVQMALYAGGSRYSCEHPVSEPKPLKEDCENNLECHVRAPLNVSQEVGLLIHLPLGEGKCDIYPLDLEFGRDSMVAVRQIKAWRSKKIDQVVVSSLFG